MPGRNVEKEQFWRLVLEEHAGSGLTARDFCRREEISEPSFYSWRRKIRLRDELTLEGGGSNGSHGLVPVTVVDANSENMPQASAASHERIEIVAPQPSGDIIVRLDPACSTDAIQRILTAIRRVNTDAAAC